MKENVSNYTVVRNIFMLAVWGILDHFYSMYSVLVNSLSSLKFIKFEYLGCLGLLGCLGCLRFFGGAWGVWVVASCISSSQVCCFDILKSKISPLVINLLF